jgi:hypothetical protein
LEFPAWDLVCAPAKLALSWRVDGVEAVTVVLNLEVEVDVDLDLDAGVEVDAIC